MSRPIKVRQYPVRHAEKRRNANRTRSNAADVGCGFTARVHRCHKKSLHATESMTSTSCVQSAALKTVFFPVTDSCQGTFLTQFKSVFRFSACGAYADD
jgi:hypothetical protein